MFKKLRKGFLAPVSMLKDSESGQFTSNVGKLAKILQQAWHPILSRHKDNPPDWWFFKDKLVDYIKYHAGAPTDTPNGIELHEVAKRGGTETAGGRDGWRPAELKLLPLRAWELRAQILALAAELRTFPSAYRHVLIAAIPKKGLSPDPVKQRLLTLFSAVYRVETKAWFRKLQSWLLPTLHPDLHGAIAGHEAIEASYDCQGGH